MNEKQISALIIGIITVLYSLAVKEGDIVSLIGIVAMCTLLGGC